MKSLAIAHNKIALLAMSHSSFTFSAFRQPRDGSRKSKYLRGNLRYEHVLTIFSFPFRFVWCSYTGTVFRCRNIERHEVKRYAFLANFLVQQGSLVVLLWLRLVSVLAFLSQSSLSFMSFLFFTKRLSRPKAAQVDNSTGSVESKK